MALLEKDPISMDKKRGRVSDLLKDKTTAPLRTAVIMAGGQGTRLASITGPLPKAMVNIRGTQNKYYGQAKDTILEHQIDILSQNGINNFILVVGNKREFIKSAFTNEIINNSVYTNTPYDRHITINFFEEQTPLGTGGSFCSKDLQKLTRGEDFLFTYSDNLFDIDVQGMYRFYKDNNADVSVLISQCSEPDDRALCVFDKDSASIKSIIPKQGKQEGPRGGIFPNTPTNGLMILSNSFFKVLPEDPIYLDFEEDVLMRLIYNPSFNVCGYKNPCYIKDIGVESRFYEGVEDLAQDIPAKRNPAKYEQSCVIFRESELLVQDQTGKISLDSDIAYTISQLNSRGIISVLEKDMSKKLNYPKEDDLIDTLLVRSQTPCYLNAKIDELSQIEEIANSWNIPPEKAYYLKHENDAYVYSTLEEGSQPSVAQNILIAVNDISYQVAQNQTSDKASTEEETIMVSNDENPEE